MFMVCFMFKYRPGSCSWYVSCSTIVKVHVHGMVHVQLYVRFMFVHGMFHVHCSTIGQGHVHGMVHV